MPPGPGGGGAQRWEAAGVILKMDDLCERVQFFVHKVRLCPVFRQLASIELASATVVILTIPDRNVVNISMYSPGRWSL
jgi:hypothetical protein